MILSGGVPMSENGKRRSYDRAFKVEAVRLVTEEKRKVTEAARELGINANQLHRWKRKLAEKGEFAFLGKGAYSEPFRHLIPTEGATSGSFRIRAGYTVWLPQGTHWLAWRLASGSTTTDHLLPGR